MGGEDGGVLLAELAGDGLAIALDFAAGGADRLVEPLQLVLDGVARDEPPRDAKSLVVHRPALRRWPRRAKRQFLVVFACDALVRRRNRAGTRGSHVHAARLRSTNRPTRPCLPVVRAARRTSRGRITRSRASLLVRASKVERVVRADRCYSTVPVSSKLRSTSSANASRAASASGPWPRSPVACPRTAASVRIARMLLPSTRSPSLITSIFDWILAGQLDEQVGRPRVQPLRVGHHDGSAHGSVSHSATSIHFDSLLNSHNGLLTPSILAAS